MIYNAFVDYGSDPVNMSDDVVWEVIPSELGYMIGKQLYTYPVDEDSNLIIKATYNDGSETHWAEFPVSVTNFLQVTDMWPADLSTEMTTAPQEMEIYFSRPVSYTHPSSTWSLACAGDDDMFGTGDDTVVPATITNPNYEDYIAINIDETLVQGKLYRLNPWIIQRKRKSY